MNENINILQSFDWRNLSSRSEYDSWRSLKLKLAEQALGLAPVAVKNIANPSESERREIILRCRTNNYAHYAASADSRDPGRTRYDLRAFAAAFGLKIAEAHRSAEEAGIVALRVSAAPQKRGYIPYTTRAINWHTDGYYNAPEERIDGFVLHCVEQALAGGENQLLDPEIAYIRLRDENPAYVEALMHPQAMSIPANEEPDGTIRPRSTGPVFYPAANGRLQMRYTARTRSIEWRDDPLTREAAEFLRHHLQQGDPLALSVRLEPGQGVLNNNILHTRTGFEDGQGTGKVRVIYRVRFSNRVEGS
jgi:alpha-ketoglutarate-dependent taurine dioxygenase